MSDRRSTDRPGGRPVDPHNISSARTPPTAVCPGSRSNLDLLTATRFCRALPGRFENAQGRSAKAYVHKSVHKRHANGPRRILRGPFALVAGIERGVNRVFAENSHQPTRQRERAMKRFKSIRHAQRFLSAFGGISPAPAVGGRLPTGDGRPLRGLERDHGATTTAAA